MSRPRASRSREKTVNRDKFRGGVDDTAAISKHASKQQPSKSMIAPNEGQPSIPDRPHFNKLFIGRSDELQWLSARVLTPRARNLIFVSGPGGVGKTALVERFLRSKRSVQNAEWFTLSPQRDDYIAVREGFGRHIPMWLKFASRSTADAAVTTFAHELYHEHNSKSGFVIVDGADVLSDFQIESLANGIFNIGAVNNLIIIRRQAPYIRAQPHADAKTLELSALPWSDTIDLLRALMPSISSPTTIAHAAQATRGFPLATMLLAKILEKADQEELIEILGGRLYDFSKSIAVPSATLIKSVAPTIIGANDDLLGRLKKQPQAIYGLSPSRFEEILADLLADMGWEVHLTQRTRDGGKDILAYLNTDLGRLLCLVEAKRYRRERKIGVELVRSLFGTLCDYQANSAMLVTTSSFSRDSHEFQKKHKYQLALKDYGDVAQWINRYKTRNGW